MDYGEVEMERLLRFIFVVGIFFRSFIQEEIPLLFLYLLTLKDSRRVKNGSETFLRSFSSY